MFQSASSPPVVGGGLDLAGAFVRAEQECLAGGRNQALTWKSSESNLESGQYTSGNKLKCATDLIELKKNEHKNVATVLCTDQLFAALTARDLSLLLRGPPHSFLGMETMKLS